MEEWTTGGHYPRNLLGGASSVGRAYSRSPARRGGDHFEARGGRQPDGVSHDVGRTSSRETDGCASLRARLPQDVQGGSDTRIEGQVACGQREDALDDQSGRSEKRGEARGGRASKVAREGRGAARRRRRPSRRSEERASRRGDLFKLPAKKGKEEGEEKEGGQGEGQDLRDKTPGAGVREHGHRPQTRYQESHQEKGQEGRQEEGQARRFFELEFAADLPGEWDLLGRGGQAVRRGGPCEDAMEAFPGRFDAEHYRAHANLDSVSVWTAMGGGSCASTSDILPVLEDEPLDKDGRSYGQREPDAELHPGHVDPGQDRWGLRCDHAEAQRPGASLQWGAFRHCSAPGVGAHRHGGDEHPHGVARGCPPSEGGAKSQSSHLEDVGEALRVGAPPGGGQSKRKGQRSEGQREAEDRSSRSRERRPRQREEVRSYGTGELSGSEVMRGEFQEPGLVPPPGGAISLRHETYAAASSPPEGLLGTEVPGPTGLGTEWSHSIEGRTFGELINHLISLFFELNLKLCLPCSKIQVSGGVFPLPDTPTGVEHVVGRLSGDGLVVLTGMCRALNSYYGAQAAERAMVPESTKVALRAMCSYATDFSLTSEKFEGLRWEQFLAVRGVDYRGEEVKLARRFTWSNIEPALPQGIGCIPLEEVCEGGTLDFVVHFEQYLLPLQEMVYTKPPRIVVEPEAWEQVCSGLLERGVCRLIPKSEIFHLDGQPIHN